MATWRDRVVIVAAVAASVATGRPRWHISVDLPYKAPTAKPLALVVESSVKPEVMCSLRGDSEAWSTVDGTKSTFVCPPGAQFVGPITIWGYAKGGCGTPEPPEGSFLRVVRLDDSDTWSMTATATIPFAHTNADGTGHAELVVHAPGHVAVSLDGRPGSSLRPGDDEIYRIDTLYLDPAHPETTLQVHAIAYGTGPAPTGTIQIEAR